MFGKCPAKKSILFGSVSQRPLSPHQTEELVVYTGGCWGGGFFGCEKETFVPASGFRVLLMDQPKYSWHLQELEYFPHVINYSDVLRVSDLSIILKQIPCCCGASVSLLVPGLLPHPCP